MRLKTKKLFTIILILILIFSTSLPAFAAVDYDAQVEVRLEEGKNTIVINGRSIASEKPFEEAGVLYVPARDILEAFGADVIWKGNGKINIVYRALDLDIVQGEKGILVNRTEKMLEAPVKVVNGTTMVPIGLFIECFEIQVSSDPSTGEIVILLCDDGAITDLSFLTGSIIESKIGNSYFGWSMNVPKGSQLGYQSFNSKDIVIVNEQRAMMLEIKIETGNGESLEDYLGNLEEFSYIYLDSEIIDSGIQSNGDMKYAELYYTGYLNEAIYHRIYQKDNFFYNTILTYENEINPEKILENKVFAAMMDSFVFGFDGSDSDVQDLSKAKDGLIHYERIVTTDNLDSFFIWEMKVPPEWDHLTEFSSRPFFTQLGLNNEKCVGIQMETVREGESILDYLENTKSSYERNYNPEFYNLKEVYSRKTGDYDSAGLVYEVKLDRNRNSYVCEDIYVIEGDIAYTITVKWPAEDYDRDRNTICSMLESLKLHNSKDQALVNAIADDTLINELDKVGENDQITSYTNEDYLWSIKIPGYWTKSDFSDRSYQFFIKTEADTYVMVEAVENDVDSNEDIDLEYFTYSLVSDDVELVEDVPANEKAAGIKTYKRRMEFDNGESPWELTYKIVKGKQYTYCFTIVIPDLCTSAANIEELQAIWESFEVDIDLLESGE